MLANLIVPVLNRYDLLARMLESIDVRIGKLIVIDNGGELEQTFDKPDLVDRAYVLSLPSNLGVAASWNLGIKLLPHERVWYFGSNDVVYQPGALNMLSTASQGSLTLSTGFPHWHTFAIGEDVIRRCGLFDERFAPAYFEDNDMLRRVQFCGLPVTHLPLPIHHDNSSTLNSDERFQAHNQRTFDMNGRFYQQKVIHNDFTWSWDLDRRRAGEWLTVD